MIIDETFLTHHDSNIKKKTSKIHVNIVSTYAALSIQFSKTARNTQHHESLKMIS